MIKSEKLTQKQLKELLDYNPETGIFRWKVNKNSRARKGNEAGYLGNGYLVTMIDGQLYGNHRLAWLYMYGYLPENDIDHINKIRDDNRICNLREASKQCNARNCGNPKNNSSGVKGVGWSKVKNKWVSSIKVNNKSKNLGYYKSFDNAVCARLAGEQCLNWSGCDNNSPAYQYVHEMLKRPKKRKLPKIIVK